MQGSASDLPFHSANVCFNTQMEKHIEATLKKLVTI